MHKKPSILLLALFAAFPSLSSAATPYFRAGGGLGLMNNSTMTSATPGTYHFKPGYELEGAVGINIDRYRLEIAVGYQSNAADHYDYDDGRVWYQGDPSPRYPGYSDSDYASIQSYMINAYADVYRGAIIPYIMGGIGIANVELKEKIDGLVRATASDGVFAWQIGAGLGVPVADKVTIDLGYRYFATQDAEAWRPGEKFSMSTSNILIGCRLDF